MPSHHLNQCWVIVNWTLRNKLQWNCNQNIHSRKWIWKYCLLKDGHFVQGEMSYWTHRKEIVCISSLHRPPPNPQMAHTISLAIKYDKARVPKPSSQLDVTKARPGIRRGIRLSPRTAFQEDDCHLADRIQNLLMKVHEEFGNLLIWTPVIQLK